MNRMPHALQPWVVPLVLLGVIAFVQTARAATTPLAASASSPVRPNILFILVDDYGIKDVGIEGSTFYETPNIDRSPAAACDSPRATPPARCAAPRGRAIMLGKYPARHGITDWIGAAVGEGVRQATARQAAGARLRPQPARRRHHAGRGPASRPATRRSSPASGTWAARAPGREDHGFDINKGGWDAGSPMGGYFSPWKNPNLPNGPTGESLTQRLASETIAFIEQQQGQAVSGLPVVLRGARADPDHQAALEQVSRKGLQAAGARGTIQDRPHAARPAGAGQPDLRRADREHGHRRRAGC